MLEIIHIETVGACVSIPTITKQHHQSRGTRGGGHYIQVPLENVLPRVPHNLSAALITKQLQIERDTNPHFEV